MIDKALATMDKSANLPPEQQFAWTAPGWVMYKVLEDWDGQTQERRDKLAAAFHRGKFAVHALPFSLESDACEPEEMARGLVFASQLARQNGKPLPTAAKVTDVPGHSNALATVLAQAGVKFLHIGCNWPAGYVKTPGLFWWEGPDGSRTLTLYSVNYGTCTAFWPKEWIPKGAPEMQVGQGLIPPPDWPYDIWPAIIVTPDNTGPPDADAVKSYFEKAQKEMPEVKFRMGTMDEFAETLLKENPTIPVIKGQMPDTWIHGILSDPEGCRLSREAHPLIAAAEVQRTQLQAWGLELPSVKKEIALAYENILLYGEHTFGGSSVLENYGENFNKNNPKVIADLEGSWEDKTDYIRKADKIAHRLTDENLQALAQAVKRTGDCAVVYNPLPWPRTETVILNGQPTTVSNIPACGYKKAAIPKPGAAQEKERISKNKETLENDFFKVTLDPSKGALVSLIDKRTNREWLDASDHGISYLNERFSYLQTLDYVTADMSSRTRGVFGLADDKNWLHPNMYKPGLPDKVPYRAASPAGGYVKRQGYTATLIMPGNPAKRLPASELRISLPTGQPFIDLELTIKDKARDNWPEADWLRLPFKTENPQFSIARALGEMNPAADILPGANQDMYTTGNGLTIADHRGGLAICPLDHPLISLDRPGCWRFSRDFTPKKSEVFVNLYNNQWNTNFRYWFPGTWSSRVRLWTFSDAAPKASRLTVPALEARNPLQVIMAKGAGGTWPEEKSGIAVSRPGVLVTAFGPDPDGNSVLLRVWEQGGVSGDLTVTLPEGVKATKAQPVNLRGEKVGEALVLQARKLTFPLKAYAPASFLLE